MTYLVRDLTARLDAFEPHDAAERRHVAKLREFLETQADVISRDNPIGHITASALVVSADESKTLLTHHAKLDRWLQFGGHIEPEDHTVPAAALRETTEESGLKNLRFHSDAIFDVDVHTIPARPHKNEPKHLHFDVRFLLVAPEEEYTVSEESNDLKWFTRPQLESLQMDYGFERLRDKWVAMAGAAPQHPEPVLHDSPAAPSPDA